MVVIFGVDVGEIEVHVGKSGVDVGKIGVHVVNSLSLSLFVIIFIANAIKIV